MVKKRKKSIYRPYLILLSFIVLLYIGKIIYVSYKCKDLYEAANYLFTTNECGDLSLMRVKNISLIYKGDDYALIQASGLNKIPPHETTYIEAEFKRNSFSSWEIDSYSEIQKN
ncbi:MAG: hypothetical protein ACRC7N_11340 [Clostridium sp.]